MPLVGIGNLVPQSLMSSGTDLAVEGAVEGNPTTAPGELDTKAVPFKPELLAPPEPVESSLGSGPFQSGTMEDSHILSLGTNPIERHP